MVLEEASLSADLLHSRQWRDRNCLDFIKKIFICVLKINKILQVWNMMSSFLGELSL